MHKLSTEQLLKIYKEAIECNVSKDFITLLSEEINKRLVIKFNYKGLFYNKY
ncbi:sporulation histidine kinase inhibitor Sda [Neobacillus cucumis]|uniref:sporulation histidine kinase inhibitor Sda n=1 Tax=Neobacillus cucumis TaxID=1740721 RepID=UPI002E22489D|nr:sporulation histidine kinase inhibitor Sda [Neobacillus cucumis]